MDELSIGPWGGVVSLAWCIVSLLGRQFKFVSKNQELSTLVIVPLLAVLSKTCGFFDTYQWHQLLLTSVFVAVLTGASHDKIAKPLVNRAAFFRRLSMVVPLSLPLVTLLSGCSVHSARWQDVQADGSNTTVSLVQIVPPGGKVIWDGSVDAGIASSGAWKLKLSQASESDLAETKRLLEELLLILKTSNFAEGALQ